MLAKSLLIYSLAAGMDIGSTRYALPHNPAAREANPIMQGQGLYVFKGLQVTALTLVDSRLQKHHKGLAKALRILTLAGQAGIAVHNLRQSHAS